jgi:hypothetical protein
MVHVYYIQRNKKKKKNNQKIKMTQKQELGVVVEFVKTLQTLVEALATGFPECMKTLAVKNAFHKYADDGGSSLVQWHTVLQNKYELCEKRDIKFLQNQTQPNNFILYEMKLYEKFQDPTFDDESKNSVWEYLLYLNCLSYVYNIIPHTTLLAFDTMRNEMCMSGLAALQATSQPETSMQTNIQNMFVNNPNLFLHAQNFLSSVPMHELPEMIPKLSVLFRMIKACPQMNEMLGAANLTQLFDCIQRGDIMQVFSSLIGSSSSGGGLSSIFGGLLGGGLGNLGNLSNQQQQNLSLGSNQSVDMLNMMFGHSSEKRS